MMARGYPEPELGVIDFCAFVQHERHRPSIIPRGDLDTDQERLTTHRIETEFVEYTTDSRKYLSEAPIVRMLIDTALKVVL
jgi:hypothetical protein